MWCLHAWAMDELDEMSCKLRDSIKPTGEDARMLGCEDAKMRGCRHDEPTPR